MKRLLTATLLFCLGTVLRPLPPNPAPNGRVWTAPIVHSALLGRRYAAADVAWIDLVQTLGSGGAESAGFPTVTDQVDLVTTLDPHFALAYHLGVIVVLTDAARADRLSIILERGQRAFPQDPEFPRMMGFLAHFGRLDFADAARHYRKAVALGGPAYLGPLADRLSTSALQCRQLRDELAAVAHSAGREEQELLLLKAAPVLTNCEKTRLQSAAGQFKLNEKRIPSLAELVERGVEEPLHPPGRCWIISPEGNARLEACP